MKRYSLLLIVLIIASCSGQPVHTPGAIEPVLLRQDLAILRDSLQNLHAGLYRYKTKPQMNHFFDSIFASTNTALTTMQFFNTVSAFVSYLQDGHTRCSLPADTLEHWKATAQMFPVALHFTGNKAYVTCSTSLFAAGTEILSIDNLSITKIREELFKHIPSDGAVRTGKLARLNGTRDPFPLHYSIVFGQKAAYNVSYRASGQPQASKVVQGTVFSEIECPTQAHTAAKPLALEFKDNTAILTISTFSSYDLQGDKEPYYEFLERSFKQIKTRNAKRLIIDLRNNGGGDDMYGAALYSYLTDKPFLYYASLSSTRKQFTATDHPGLAVQQPAKDNFKGEVLFLIDGGSFSATSEICAVAKSNGRGKFVGEETGGGYYGNTSGARQTVTLPHSKISVSIPLWLYVTAVKKDVHPNRGIIPDYTVAPTIDDLLSEKDVAMAFALTLH